MLPIQNPESFTKLRILAWDWKILHLCLFVGLFQTFKLQLEIWYIEIWFLYLCFKEWDSRVFNLFGLWARVSFLRTYVKLFENKLGRVLLHHLHSLVDSFLEFLLQSPATLTKRQGFNGPPAIALICNVHASILLVKDFDVAVHEVEDVAQLSLRLSGLSRIPRITIDSLILTLKTSNILFEELLLVF